MGAARGSRHPYVPRRERTWAATDGAQCAQAWRDSCMDSCIMGAHGHGGAVQRARGARERWRERACAKELTPAPHGRIWKHFARFTGHSRFRILLSYRTYACRRSSIDLRGATVCVAYNVAYHGTVFHIRSALSSAVVSCVSLQPSFSVSLVPFTDHVTTCDWRTALPLRIGTVCS